MDRRKQTIRLITILIIAIVVIVISTPAVILSILSTGDNIVHTIWEAFISFAPLLFLFLFNFLYLTHKFLFTKDKKKWFYIINVILIFGWRIYKMIPQNEIPQEMMDSFGEKIVIFWAYTNQFILVVDVIFVLFAVGLRYLIIQIEQNMKYEEQKKNNVEAELSWLKNQLNPHFLFNTLNNISSLTAIDPDAAQESIAELSSLMRYVLYDSEKERVPLSCELEFMENYINLMKLRCTSSAQVQYSVSLPQESVEIAPLLFISIVENAFKHGVKSNANSFISIKMTASGRDLVFSCTNSLFEKQKTDMAGSGIGIQNMKKRLELIYPDQYSFTFGPTENEYNSTLVIKDLFNEKK